MKRLTILLLTAGVMVPLMLSSRISFGQAKQDTLKDQVITLRDRISGIEERIATAESDLAKLTKIKLSGYIQAQYQRFENPSTYPYNTFTLRRVRIKFQYEPINGVVFVLQPDFSPGSISLKDAYAMVNEPWLKTFSLWAGQFNRPNYEVEYSSSNREVPERSAVIRALYPGERAIGAKLEIAPPKIPLKFQFAVFNGNDGMTINTKVYNAASQKWDNLNVNPTNKDFDKYKDLMARLTYGFKLGNWGGLNIGVHGYYGWIKSNSTDVLNSDYTYNKSVTVGQALNKSWIGAEAQVYFDLWGGLTIKGEYIFGKNAYPGYSSDPYNVFTNSSAFNNAGDTLTLTNLKTTTTQMGSSIERSFMGYYAYLIKNIGKRNQFAVRWDYYDPNTKLSADQIGVAKYDAKIADVVKNDKQYAGSDPVIITNNQTKTIVASGLKSGVADVAYGTLTLAWTYFFDDNIKFMLAYEMPFNEKVAVNDKGVGNVVTAYNVNGEPGILDYSKVFPQNTLTFRIQVKF
ncbi:MAG: hypothetical protein WCO93_01355 [bacterium]